jgi:ribonuclease P protein component
MLPESVRLRRRTDFDEVVRHGRRAGRSTLVVHLWVPDRAVSDASAGSELSKVGFIVSKQVGNSVHRHRVTRQLRHLMRDRLETVPGGSRVVVRARPDAAGRSSADLGRDLDSALRRLSGRPTGAAR